MNPTMLALAVERAVRTRRFRYSNETDLQRGLGPGLRGRRPRLRARGRDRHTRAAAQGAGGRARVERRGRHSRSRWSAPTGIDREILLAERKLRQRGKDRIDFLIGGEVGAEVKIDGSLTEVTTQLHRYAQSDRVKALVLISSRMRLDNMPSTLNGKPLRVVTLAGGFP
jgi:hypothetical protein